MNSRLLREKMPHTKVFSDGIVVTNKGYGNDAMVYIFHRDNMLMQFSFRFFLELLMHPYSKRFHIIESIFQGLKDIFVLCSICIGNRPLLSQQPR